MNINFVRKTDNLYAAVFTGKFITELYKDSDGNDDVIRAFCFDPEKNTVFEIAPEIKKYSSIFIKNCIYNSSCFYFASYEASPDGILFCIYEYDCEKKHMRPVLNFIEDADILSASSKIKLFILDKSNILVQFEKMSAESEEGLMGAILFKIKLCNIESGEIQNIQIPDFINNGINSIIPISENRLIIKCGYSFIEDERFSAFSEKEALIESIYLSSTTQFIADLKLNLTAGNMKLIDTAYFEKCICAPRAKDEYLYYETVNNVENTADITFVNVNTMEQYKYRRTYIKNDGRIEAMVIQNTPYIRIRGEEKETFLNLKSTLMDMEFLNESFVCCCGSLLVFKRMRGKKEKMRIYAFPASELVFEGQYGFDKMISKEDEYYIYY